MYDLFVTYNFNLFSAFFVITSSTKYIWDQHLEGFYTRLHHEDNVAL